MSAEKRGNAERHKDIVAGVAMKRLFLCSSELGEMWASSQLLPFFAKFLEGNLLLGGPVQFRSGRPIRRGKGSFECSAGGFMIWGDVKAFACAC